MRENQLEKIKQSQIDSGEIPLSLTKDTQQVFAGGSQLEIMQQAMDVDLGKLKAFNDIDDKIRFKFDSLHTYMPFVLNYISQGHKYPNSVAVHVMIWLFDVRDIDQALALGLHLVKQKVHKLPGVFNRTNLETFICDEMYDWASKLLEQDHGVNPYMGELISAIEQDNWQVPPVVKSKCFVMYAKHLVRLGEDTKALEYCRKAESINGRKAGVKTLKAEIQKRLSKATVSTAGGG